MNIIKKVIQKILDVLMDDVNWAEVSTLNPDHVNVEKVGKILGIWNSFAQSILLSCVRRGEAVRCCSYYDSMRHKDCYRFISKGKGKWL